MMVMRVLVLFFVTALTGPAAAEDPRKSFALTIDGKTYEINEGEQLTITTADGKQLPVSLRRNDVVTFVADGLSFDHPGALSVAHNKISDAVDQYLMVTASGTYLILQSYDDTRPSTLTSYMLNEITDEDLAAGAKLVSEPGTIRLSDGTTVSGKKAKLTATDDDITLNVMAHDKGRGGYLFITSHDRITAPEEASIVELFWLTLKVSE
jgi:hypothetical protein